MNKVYAVSIAGTNEFLSKYSGNPFYIRKGDAQRRCNEFNRYQARVLPEKRKYAVVVMSENNWRVVSE